MNAVAMLVFDSTDEQFQLTKAAVMSVLNQDIPVNLWIVDNGSTYEPTKEWLIGIAIRCHQRIQIIRNPENQSPVRVTNRLFGYLFSKDDCEYILGVPNDVELPPNFYSQLLKCPRGIVTASMTQDREAVHHDGGSHEAFAVSECTPLAVGLIRKWAHDALVAKDGFFLDPRFEFYCSDCDLALRMAACGIRGIQLSIPYWHFCSASHRLAADGVGKSITDRADIDREVFRQKWGFGVSDEAYGIACGNINFRGESK
jgi:GT2 family glycosyltransferase